MHGDHPVRTGPKPKGTQEAFAQASGDTSTLLIIASFGSRLSAGDGIEFQEMADQLRAKLPDNESLHRV
jgi:hypothetical protein